MSGDVEFDLGEAGGRILSVFGPFNSRVLVEIPATLALQLFKDTEAPTSRTRAIEAVERDLEVIRRRSPELADSVLAAGAVAMAYELEDPYNSATSKSMCQKALLDTMARLRELAPVEQERDDVDELRSRRAARRNRSTEASGL